jgi:hypothetical protein
MKVELSGRYAINGQEGDKQNFFGVEFTFRKGWFAEVDDTLAEEMESVGRADKVKVKKRV